MKTLREMMDIVEAAQQPVEEGFSDVVKGVKRAVKGKEDPTSAVARRSNAAFGALASGDKEAIRKAERNLDRVNKVTHGKLGEQGVEEGSDELYQKAIRKYVQRVANDYLGGGSAHLYGANDFDAEMFGVSPKQADQDFEVLFPQALKQLQGRQGSSEEQLEETTPEAIQKVNKLFQK